MSKVSPVFYRSLFLSALMLMLTFAVPAAFAQASTFTYQGRLTQSNSPADGVYDIRFKLFDTPDLDTGTQQGATISRPTTQVTNGVFTAQLDFGPIVFTGAARFLEISIRPTGDTEPHTVLGPRQPLTAAPYAFRSASAALADFAALANVASNASQLGGITASGFIQNTTSQQATSNFNISGNGTAGGVLSANTLNAATQYNINGNRVLSIAGFNNMFSGFGAGTSNAVGQGNAFFGAFAGTSNLAGNLNSFFGAGAGASNATGSENTFVGRNAGNANNVGNNITIIGDDADVGVDGLSFATAIGAGAVVNTSDTVVLGRSEDDVRVPGTLVVSTLVDSGAFPLCRTVSNRLANCSSSLRYKERLAPFTAGLELINRLRPITFTWKQGGVRDLGLGAEDVAAIEPLLVTYNERGEIEGVKYDRVAVVLINVVKQQQAEIDELKRLACKANPKARLCR